MDVLHINRLFVLIIVAVVFTTTASAKYSGVNGGVVAIDLPENTVEAKYGNEPQLIVNNTAFVAIPLETEPSDREVVLITQEDGSTQEVHFIITEKEYQEQRITLANQDYVTPPQETLDRIARDSKDMKEAYARRSPQLAALVEIDVPVEGITTGVFGTKRFFNDQPRNPHSGVDYAADTGTPIITPAPGEVVLAKDMYFNGNTVVVDHGMGFLSVLCHLNEISVEVGDEVKRKQVVGTVGSTGRSTGPHLHWTVSLQGTKVDPDILMDAINSLSEEDSE